MILLLKAQIRGGAAGDLFSAPVTVGGHVRGATYVAPYQATRHHAPAPAPAPVAAGAAPSLVARETGPDGRLVLQVGDAVYQAVPGPFGLPATVHGEVFAGKGGLRVRVTGSSSLIGSARPGATYPADGHWTVVGDPEIARRKAAREAAIEAEKPAIEADRAAEEARIAALAAERGTLDEATVNPGDVVEDPEGVPWLVTEKDAEKGWLYGHPLDAPEDDMHSGGIGDPRGWRKLDMALPDRPYTITEHRPGDAWSGTKLMRVGGAWVPVAWDEDANEYRPIDPEAPAKPHLPTLLAERAELEESHRRRGTPMRQIAARLAELNATIAEGEIAAGVDKPTTAAGFRARYGIPADWQVPETHREGKDRPRVALTPNGSTKLTVRVDADGRHLARVYDLQYGQSPGSAHWTPRGKEGPAADKVAQLGAWWAKWIGRRAPPMAKSILVFP